MNYVTILYMHTIHSLVQIKCAYIRKKNIYKIKTRKKKKYNEIKGGQQLKYGVQITMQ